MIRSARGAFRAALLLKLIEKLRYSLEPKDYGSPAVETINYKPSFSYAYTIFEPHKFL